ncbi:hypothetical protein BMQ_pBM70097 (plasmid) [Priestia megaterium QM B1551]|uniref:Uncharacterized protein n=1 Tax=Priestia megaterium (strain ATCC 12872 / QMB1551) TaxID=545693 RepID=D5E4B4_PRIM1|nr:hypothetical protein BMQ_pBM70097 [Priestia megaterium QM B1551]
MKDFLRGIGKERMHKKAVFYTYARPHKNSLYESSIPFKGCCFFDV